jgi:subtilisin family serine protease
MGKRRNMDCNSAMRSVGIQRALRRRLLERHTDGRAYRQLPDDRRFREPPAEQVLQTWIVHDRRPIFVVSDILVRWEDAERAAPLLAARGFQGPERAVCQGDCAPELPVAIFTKPGGTVDEFTHAVDELLDRDDPINASFNHVLSNGGAKNGFTGPTLSRSRLTMETRPDPTAGEGVIVAVIDTGIAECVEIRDDGVLEGIRVGSANVDPLNAINWSDSPQTRFLDMGAGHGTFVAGVIRQIAPKADVRVYRALDSDGIGTEVEIACAILRAWRDGATIINLSLGQETYRDRPPVALEAALELISDDVVVVASAGNLDDQHVNDTEIMRPHWPAAFRRVVAVGALTADYRPAPWSKRGQWVDVSTWGTDVVSTYVQGVEEGNDTNPEPDEWPASDPDPWAKWSGTSFSAPQISGLLAAGMAPHRYSRRDRARHTLSELMGRGGRGYWYVPGYGLTIPTPFLT